MSQLALDVGTFPDGSRKEELSQHFTPASLAERIVAFAGIEEGERVLEPSAGSGAFVGPLLKAGAQVTAIEIDGRYVDHLSTTHPAAHVIEADFLAVTPFHVDLVLMNPPYENGLDGAFIAHALKFAPRVIALIRTHALHGRERYGSLWRHTAITRLALCVNRPSFGGGSPMHEFCVVEVKHALPTHRLNSPIRWWEI